MSKPHRPGKLQRRTTVNIMLYVGVLAMAMLTYYDYRERTKPAADSRVLPAEDVIAVGIHRPGHRTIDIEKRADGNWQIVGPIARAAQPSRIDALLTITSLDPDDAYAADELDLGELGLGTPLATINLSDGTNLTHVQIGGHGPNGKRRYIRVSRHVWLSDDVFLPLLQGGLSAFADLTIASEERTLESIDGIAAAALEQWYGSAANIVPSNELEESERRKLTVSFSDGGRETWILLRTANHYALVPEQANYALLLTDAQVGLLGIDP